jgi:FAD:protein FMN transferase
MLFDSRPRRITVALGTFVSIEAQMPAGADAALSPASLDAACAVFQVIDSTMHPTQERSDLAAIAGAVPGEVVRVHPWTFEVLALARRIWVASGGRFDPCLPEQPGRLGDLELIAPSSVVRRTGASLALDLGGIAKGFAVDRAVDALRSAGCVAGQVNAGGDLRVFGEGPAAIQIRTGGVLGASVPLRNEALAVSEARSLNSPSEHRGFYSGVTGEVVPGRVVAIVAPTAAVADALTKCAIVCPRELLEHVLRLFDARAIELPADGG